MEKVIVERNGSLRAVRCMGRLIPSKGPLEGVFLGLDCQAVDGNRFYCQPAQARDGDWDALWKEEESYNKALKESKKGIGQVTVSYKGSGFTNAQRDFHR